MKTKLYSLILFVALAFAAPKVNAQYLIHFWDFNTTVAGDSLGNATNPLPASYTTLSTSNPKIVYTRPYSMNMYKDSILNNGSGGAFYYDFSSVNYLYFNTSDSAVANQYVRIRNPSAGAYLMFYIPTTGYKNITFNYALSASSSKAPNTVFQYSTNGGSSWNVLTAAMDTFNTMGRMHADTLQNVDSITAVSGWRPVSIDFSSDPSTNNCAGFMVRMQSCQGLYKADTVLNDTMHSGNVRFDNFAIMGDTNITGIDNITALAAGYEVYPNPANNVVNIVSDKFTGQKVITLFDVIGQTVSVTENKDKQTLLDISALSTGLYFVQIKEVSTGNSYTVKLAKE